MTKNNIPITSFNQGIVSKLALGRVDVARLKFAAEEQENWTPRTLGPMSLRNGLGYISNTWDDLRVTPIPFIFAHDDTAIIEFFNHLMMVRVNEQWIQRSDVTAQILNPDFTSSIHWDVTASAGAEALFGASIGGAGLMMKALGINSHVEVTQEVGIYPQNYGMEHALRIMVLSGPVGFRVGTQPGLDDLFKFSLLDTGWHSLAFIPMGTPVYVRFESTVPYGVIVSHVQFENSAAPMAFYIPYNDEDLDTISYAQSGDIIYLAHKSYAQMKIERRGIRSWSLVYYRPEDGPFQLVPPVNRIITPSGEIGDIFLTSDLPYFTPDMQGALMRLFMSGQTIYGEIGAEDSWSDPIRVTGVAGERQFNLYIDGTWSGTLTLQRSSDSAEAGFEDVKTYTADTGNLTPDVINDGFDNSIIWYRIGFKVGDYTSGLAETIMVYPNGGGPGVVRIAVIDSPTHCSAQVIVQLPNIAGTRDWLEGDWSNHNGWPSCVALSEGRLWWFGQDRIWGSVSDAFESFDDTVVGDAGPIIRSIGFGPVETINWVLPLQRIVLGLQSSEVQIKASQLDQPLTPTNFAISIASTQGSVQTPAVQIDTRGIFIQCGKRRVYQIGFDIQNSWNFQTTDLTLLLPDLESNFVQLAVQRQPDTRIHCLREDGTVLVAAFEPLENVICWYKVSTPAADGMIERMIIMPGDVEDKVYYYTKRTIDGTTVRFLEKQALDSECQGGLINKQADTFFHIHFDPPNNVLDVGLGILRGQDVVVWADGADLGTFNISLTEGLTLPVMATDVVFGLPYTAQFKSAKLAYSAQMGTALSQPKRINSLGVILNNTHAQGLEFGQSFDRMNNLPMVYQGKTITTDLVFGSYDTAMVTLPGNWDTDARLCLRATAPRPCTLLGAVIGLQTHDTL